MKTFCQQIVTFLALFSFLGFLNLKQDKKLDRFIVTRWVLMRNFLCFPIISFLKSMIPMEIILKGSSDVGDLSDLLTVFFKNVVIFFKFNQTATISLLSFIQILKRHELAYFVQTLCRFCAQNSSVHISKKSLFTVKIFIVGIVLKFVTEFLAQQKYTLFGLISFIYINVETFFILGYNVAVSGFLRIDSMRFE